MLCDAITSNMMDDYLSCDVVAISYKMAWNSEIYTYFWVPYIKWGKEWADSISRIRNATVKMALLHGKT